MMVKLRSFKNDYIKFWFEIKYFKSSISKLSLGRDFLTSLREFDQSELFSFWLSTNAIAGLISSNSLSTSEMHVFTIKGRGDP